MRIRMIKSARGSEDGVNLRDYREGEHLDFTGKPARALELARVFLQQNWAEEITAQASPAVEVRSMAADEAASAVAALPSPPPADEVALEPDIATEAPAEPAAVVEKWEPVPPAAPAPPSSKRRRR